MFTECPDGSVYYHEYAVNLPDGRKIGPYSKAEASRLAHDCHGTLTRRRITHGPWEPTNGDDT